jgi:hypothetical protein
MKYADVDKLNAELKPFIDKIKKVGGRSDTIQGGTDQIVRDIENNPAVALKFLTENGIKPSKDGWSYYHSQINSNKTLDEKFQTFLDNIYKKYNVEEKLFAGYTYSGKRRYKKATVEEASKIMSKQKDEGYNYGLGSYRSKIAPVKTSPEAIKKEAGRLMSKEDFEKAKELYDNELYSIQEDLAKYVKSKNDNQFIEFDNQNSAIGSVLMGEKDSWKYFNQKFGENVPTTLIDRIQTLKTKLKKMPTEYFETKFKRPIKIDQFKYALVPEETSEQSIKLLQSKGIEVVKYAKGKKQEALKKFLSDSQVAFGVGGFTLASSKNSQNE